MSTEPLISAQLNQYAIQSPSAVALWSFTTQARAQRSQEIVKAIVSFGSWLRTRVVEPMLWAVEAERSYNELMSLDERTLQDIGIRREEIPQVVARGIAQRKLAAYAAGKPTKSVAPVVVPVQAAPAHKLAA